MDPVQLAIIVVQIARAYKLFSEATADMTPEEKAKLWERTQSRAVQAREIWQSA